MPKTTRPCRSWQLGKLTDPKIAANYLNASLEESPELFLKALGYVAQANRMSKVAKEAGLQRETLYRSLTEQGNPTFQTLSSILSVLGMKMLFIPEETAKTHVVLHSESVLQSAKK
jgi:probable addiction module antidote protein